MLGTDPRLLASIRDLRLVAGRVVDGMLVGAHASRRVGAGIEFSQYRSYQPGDDLRRIDWKLYGRSDRYFVRESEAETSITIHLVLDATASMRLEYDGLSKFDYARFLAAGCTLLAQRQGDAAGLVLAHDGMAEVQPASRDRSRLSRLFHLLEQAKPGGRWPDPALVSQPLAAQGQRGLVILITDFHEDGIEVRETIRAIAAMRHDVLVFHLIAPDELTLDFGEVVTLEDLETGAQREVDCGGARAGYQASLAEHFRRLESDCASRLVDYQRISTATPLDRALRRLLVARQRLG
ncbi:MAG: DUF58 domain-containing protein [Gemmatimonadales bacterium]|nr:DUF58 domain-containing protein [Gemmatimonadales bacterium]